ncbi:hypothetical protein BDZ94DRAFT_672219 [Collybia nuda]|uniref:Uncharacterized protein n=1 Tax=Collybia nuda TaxID=64659 RepID=A0A9P5YFW8_9AGAR|nr:hypothetical protein BDZ94DRAFT_672219 [Collybia nuda]
MSSTPSCSNLVKTMRSPNTVHLRSMERCTYRRPDRILWSCDRNAGYGCGFIGICNTTAMKTPRDISCRLHLSSPGASGELDGRGDLVPVYRIGSWSLGGSDGLWNWSAVTLNKYQLDTQRIYKASYGTKQQYSIGDPVQSRYRRVREEFRQKGLRYLAAGVVTLVVGMRDGSIQISPDVVNWQRVAYPSKEH